MQGAIGILDRRDMDHFAEIFLALQKRGMTKNEKGIAETAKPHISPVLIETSDRDR